MRVAACLVVLLAAMATLATARVTSHNPTTTTMSVTVLPVQVLEGTTVHVLSTPLATQPGRLIV